MFPKHPILLPGGIRALQRHGWTSPGWCRGELLGKSVPFLGLPDHYSIPTSLWGSSTEGKGFGVLACPSLTQCLGVLKVSPQQPHMGLPHVPTTA